MSSKVIIEVRDGAAHLVQKPVGVEVEIRDYDCQGCEHLDKPECTDDDGCHMHSEVYESDVNLYSSEEVPA